MDVNFKLKDVSDLSYEGRLIDLHNNFDFTGYELNLESRELTMFWIKSTGDWVKENEYNKLTLIHSNVFFLNIRYDNKDYQYPNDDNCLEIVSFFPSSDRETNFGWIERDQPMDGDDILYFFISGHFIRVGCDKVELLVD